MISTALTDHTNALIHHLQKTQEDSDQGRIAIKGLKLLLTLLRKNSSYGSSVFTKPVIAADATPEQGIRVRMSDKIARIQTLLKLRTSEPNIDCFESLQDTFLDLAGYAILWAVESDLHARQGHTMQMHGVGVFTEKGTEIGSCPKTPLGPPPLDINRHALAAWLEDEQREYTLAPEWKGQERAFRDGWHHAFHTIIEKILKTP